MRKLFVVTFLALLPLSVLAQQTAQTSGTLVVLPASGEVHQANDQATLLFAVEEQDRDQAAAASRVNRKMKQGADILKRRDPSAQLKTGSYSSYPVYAQPEPRTGGGLREPSGWRVRQTMEMVTSDLGKLPDTVSAAQGVLALVSLHFGLADTTARKLDEERIAATWRNLGERIAAVARAMGRNASDATLESLDFDAPGMAAPAGFAARAMAAPGAAVEAPSFEPGETTLQMHAVGKIRFR